MKELAGLAAYLATALCFVWLGVLPWRGAWRQRMVGVSGIDDLPTCCLSGFDCRWHVRRKAIRQMMTREEKEAAEVRKMKVYLAASFLTAIGFVWLGAFLGANFISFPPAWWVMPALATYVVIALISSIAIGKFMEDRYDK